MNRHQQNQKKVVQKNILKELHYKNRQDLNINKDKITKIKCLNKYLLKFYQNEKHYNWVYIQTSKTARIYPKLHSTSFR